MRAPPSIAFAVIVAGCTTSPPRGLPEAPSVLQPPAGQSLYVEALATGVQIYECSRKADASFGWVFKAPEATLVSRSGQPLGKHYAGPTWESTDGSTVVGTVQATDPGPTASAIPWLLVTAKANTGAGTFGAAKSIQRLATVGGVSPPEPCTSGMVQQVVRVPYTATYYFYR